MIFEIIILILAIPLGYWCAYLARDEILIGRKFFLAILAISFICIWVFLALNKIILVYAFSFILIFTSISYWKSFDKKFVKKPFK